MYQAILAAVATGQQLMSNAAAAAGGGGGILDGLYTGVKSVSPPLVKLGLEIAELPGKIQEWGRQLVESQRYLSQYNGTIAGATAQLDANRLRREIDKGQQTSESFARLAKKQDELEESMQPSQNAWQNMRNNVQASLTGATASLVRSFNDSALGRAFIKMGDAADKTDPNKDPFINEVFHTMADDVRKKNRQPLPKL